MPNYAVAANGNFPDDDGLVVKQGTKMFVLPDPDGATVALQIKNADGSWQVMTGGSFTTLQDKRVFFDSKQRIRFNVTSYNTAFTIGF